MSANKVEVKPMDPPTPATLPQGAAELLAALKNLHVALHALHAPYLELVAPVRENYLQASRLARELGFYCNDTITLVMNPSLGKAMAEAEKKRVAAGKPAGEVPNA